MDLDTNGREMVGSRHAHRTRRRAAGLVGALLAAGGIAVGSAPAAQANTWPTPGFAAPATVTADVLPTVQINGVVWAQEIVGNTVYVGGSFTFARPAGSAPGVNQVARNNFLAYNLSTGELLPIVLDANAQVRTLEKSPDGTRLYVGGDFTTFGGQTRSRIAAINTATNTLTSFAPSIGWHVYDISTTNTTVYVGGNFTNVGATPRDRLAAFTTAGALLSWAPTGVEREVTSIEVSPDATKVAIGGKFEILNGSSAFGRGVGFVDAVTGATLPFAASSVIRNGGPDGGITSLHSDGELLYGTGFTFGRTAGTIEGVFAAEWSDGSLRWVEDCHGDSYSVTTQADVVYSAGHAHYCGNIGGFGQPDAWEYNRAIAHSKAVAGVVATERLGYTNFAGLPRPELLNFFPTFNAGTFTGQSQGPWSVSADGRYVVYGGEFTSVNGTAQQGLVRFQRRGFVQNRQGPQLFEGAGNYPIKAQSYGTGSVTVHFQANRDRDDATLTYRVFRRNVGTTGDGTVRHTRSATAPFWATRPVMTFTDTGGDVVPGTTYEYRVQATDGNGNFANSPWAQVTVRAAGSTPAYLASVLASEPDALWTFDEAPGATVAADTTGWRPATVPAGVTFGQAGATGGTAASFNGAAGTFVRTEISELPPHELTLEAWFRAPATANGGLIVGFNNSNTANVGAGSTAAHDRHIYMDTTGRVHFAANPTNPVTVSSARDYRDNQWHHVVGRLGPQGMQLFVDGALASFQQDVQWGRTGYFGFVRIGGGALNGFPNTNTGTGRWFDGQIDDVALYKRALPRTDIVAHYEASGRAVQAPTEPYALSVWGEAPALYWRLGEAAPATTAVDSGPQGRNGTYVGGVTLGSTGAIVDSTNTAATFNGTNGRVNTQTAVAAPQVFSQELWFRTTSTTGGKLIGFGDVTGTAASLAYDRHLYLQNDGRIVFGTSAPTATNATQLDPAQQNRITSPLAYNDGAWHHVVSTMGAGGMKLYVDGVMVGSNPATSARAYNGFWRVGGDPTWGSTSAFFGGSIDEVAVYTQELDAAHVAAQYALGSSDVPNTPPIASFTATVDPVGGLSTAFDGSASSDPDGTIASYRWDFGDGAPAVTLATPTTTHVYAAGTYTATLTVTDDDGATDVRTATVVVPGANVAPTASFTARIVGRDVTFDAAASADPNGSIVQYAWAFGDGATQNTTTPSAQRTYATSGTFSVTLTVTDDRGATGSLTRLVSTNTLAVAPPPPASVLATDSFGRTVVNGFGTADTGGAWTVTGTTSNYAVNGTTGTLRMAAAASGPIARLDAVSAVNTDTTVDVSFDKAATGGGIYFTTVGRRVGTSEYRATARLQANGTVQALLVRRLGATDTNLAVVNAVPGITLAPGQSLTSRVEVTGTNPTTLRFKLWSTGTPEPAAWTLTATDSDATLQAAGSIGVNSYLSGSATNAPVVATVDNLRSIDPLAPTSAPPTARFAATTAGLTADLDAAISVDDGSIVGWSWNFGDGATSTSGPTVAHTWAVPGTYAVQLTVTDNQGLTGQTTLNVSVG